MSRPLRAPLLALALGLCALLAACQGGGNTSAPSFKATDITGADFGRGFQLHDAASGEPRSLEDYRGKVLVLFFGYMYCPDYCPTTMATLAQALKNMAPEDAARVQVAMITVDPARDTPERLQAYVTAFNPGFVGLYGDDTATATTAREFKIIYQKSQGRDAQSYLVDHSTQMYAFDPAGRIRLMIRHETGADAIAADLTTLTRS